MGYAKKVREDDFLSKPTELSHTMSLSTITELIDDIRQGKMVILIDDEDRENEGDLVMAANFVTADAINFMARFARGLICLTLTRERCQKLNLPLMTNQPYAKCATNFTVSIEAAMDVTTGISAADRAKTIQAAVATDAKPTDLVQPGHVFPLMAQPGGVLTRAGHTEAGCDLAQLAELPASAVIVEILNDDGSMARLPDLKRFAKKHTLKIGAIADLIRYRIEHEKNIERIDSCNFPTEYGNFMLLTYTDKIEQQLHFALVKGEIKADEPVFVRVQLDNPISELAGPNNYNFGWPMNDVLQRLAKEQSGVVVILCNQLQPKALIEQIKKFKSRQSDPPKNRKESIKDLRTIGLGGQILSDIGVKKMRVLSMPKRIHALSGFGLEVVEYIT